MEESSYRRAGKHHQQQQQQNNNAPSSSTAATTTTQQHYQKTYTLSDIARFRPKLEIEHESDEERQIDMKRVIFHNVRVISNQINRRPQYVMKFLSHCLQRTSYYNANRNVGMIMPEQPLQHSSAASTETTIDFYDIRLTQNAINNHLQSYVKKYVQCPACFSLQTMNPISQEREDQDGDELFTFSISCKLCNSVTPLEVKEDGFLQDIAQSRNRNAEKMMYMNARHQRRQYDVSGAYEEYYDPYGGGYGNSYPSYYHQVNGVTYFDAAPPPQNGEMYYPPSYYPTIPVYGANPYYNGYPPYMQPPPGYGYPMQADQLQHEEGMYTSESLEKQVFEQQQQQQQQHSHLDDNNFAYTTNYPQATGSPSNNSSNSSNGNHPETPFVPNDDPVESVYKSAGILPYSYNPQTNDLVFLLGKEIRGGSKKQLKNVPTWCEFGGKKEKTDRDSIDTASREFCEETVASFRNDFVTADDIGRLSAESLSSSQQHIQNILRSFDKEQLQNHSVYFEPGKYRLFFVPVQYVDPEMLEKAYHENQEKKIIPSAPKSEFTWVEANHLFNLVFGDKKKQDKSKAISENNLLQISPGRELHPFFVSMIRGSRSKLNALIKAKSNV
jgi:translation initiation factor 2 beta subunit (eIF-2beta)/eIF-5